MEKARPAHIERLARRAIAIGCVRPLPRMGRKQADVNSYAPNLVLQTDLFRIDFRETRVVLSRRESKQAVWSQTLRKRSSEDSALEALVLKGISSLANP